MCINCAHRVCCPYTQAKMDKSTPTVYVIVGGTRGIGLAVVKQLASRQDAPIVFATARKPKEAHLLNTLAAQLPNAHVVEADLTKNFDTAAAEVKKHVDGVDVLVVVGAEFQFGKLTEDTVDQKIMTLIDMNALGALRALRAFLPLLRNRPTKKVINISSSAGSLTLNSPEAYGKLSGCHVPYGMSKVLLNGITRQAANDFKAEGFTIVPICPGSVNTDGVQVFWKAMGLQGPPPFPVQTPEECAQKLVTIIDRLTPEQNGSWLNELGATIPW